MKISDHHHHHYYHPYHPDLGRGLQTQLEDVARGEAPVNVRVGLQRVKVHIPKYFRIDQPNIFTVNKYFLWLNITMVRAAEW